jgi:uncharacterized protein YjbJ (UPF0337 family)
MAHRAVVFDTLPPGRHFTDPVVGRSGNHTSSGVREVTSRFLHSTTGYELVMDKDKMDQMKGRAEQAAGDLTDDERLRRQGQRHEQGGKLKEGISNLSKKAAQAVDKAQERMDKNNK